jgi:hypothetical protein
VFPQVSAGRDHIMNQHASKLPRSRMRSPPFAVFPQGLKVTVGSWIDHYFPLKE